MYNAHLTGAIPVVFLQNIHCILWTIWGYHVQPGGSVRINIDIIFYLNIDRNTTQTDVGIKHGYSVWMIYPLKDE